MGAPMQLAAIRSAVMLAVERRTLRGVAAELGVTHPAVLNFIEGAEPRPATLRKLQAWYVQHGAGLSDVSGEAIDAALALLVSGVPEPQRVSARERLLTALRDAYAAAGAVIPPEWKESIE